MSKRKWHHPEVPVEERGSKAWRSAGELEDTPGLRQWVDKEFPRASEMMRDEGDQETTRRSFLKLMGASTALAGLGLASCRRPEALIVPYLDSVEWTIPGKATYYATSMPSASGAIPLVAANYEGRPTKLDGNKQNPGGNGVDAMAQASILGLYDPARSRFFLESGKSIGRNDAVTKLNDYTKSGNFGIIFGEDDSLTRSDLIAKIKAKHTGAKFYSYEALAGAGKSASDAGIFGKHALVKADFSKASKILSLDCDFLELDHQGGTKAFYDRRRPEGADYNEDPIAYKDQLNRLYCVEPTYSVTGGMADHRAPLAPSQMGRFINQLASIAGVGSVSNPFEGQKLEWAQKCYADLKAGGGVILLGCRYAKEFHDVVFQINTALGAYSDGVLFARKGKQDEDLGTMEDFAKDASSLETVILMTPANPVYENPTVGEKSFIELVSDKKVIHWGDQVNASANSAALHIPAAHYLESWGDGFSGNDGVYTVVQPMILPLYGGIQELELLIALTQDKLNLHDSTDAKAISPAYDAVKRVFEAKVKIGSSVAARAANWQTLLRTGFNADFKYETASAGVAPSSKIEVEAEPKSATQPDIVFATDYSVLDGRYVNNAWLQEAPDPISKLTWDNAVYMSPQTAKDLGLYEEIVELEKEEKAWWANLGIATETKVKTTSVSEDGEGPSLFGPMVNVKVGGKSLKAVVIVAFGMADNVISLPLGYGQGHDKHWEDNFIGETPEYGISTANVSSVGLNAGFNGYALRNGTDYYAAGITIEKVAKSRYKLARTQEHHSMYGRALAREISTMATEPDGHDHQKDYKEQLENVRKQGMDSHIPQNVDQYKPVGNAKDKDGNKIDRDHLWDKSHQWAMSIDLSTCTGCNACLVACQAENNIPVVGKVQVAMGREMHWVRMDRYFAEYQDHGEGDHEVSNPSEDWDKPLEMIPNPVSCVQCESAPCETVCPVNATVHSEDGLNTMAYNRCIGTRYCANNCPYKARRFNFFDYNKRNPLLHKNLYKGPLGEKQEGDSKSLQRNPNVSVRMRGVMEKCTYCVQKLQIAKIDAKQNVKRAVQKSGKSSTEFKVTHEMLMAPANSVTVACQDACSAGSIVFGNLLNKKDNIQKTKALREEDQNLPSHVQGEFANPRTYDLLHYLGTRPRTSYMARVKNPNPAMKGATNVGRATINMH
ncbi:MAG: MoCo/4Fe-4S cofactor protein with predicted Tat translocation signal [Cryomorphaceae bacterium]|jgi:MoCo/4Fe-4S cofactor protein with predicted Tat translocation signal